MALTAKQEAFAQAVASGMNQSDAYRSAYSAGKMKDASINVNASKMAADAKVALRVAELRKPVADAAQVTLAGHLKRLSDLSDAAEREGKYSAAVAAEVARGKASGLYVDKMEHTGKDGAPIDMSIQLSFVKPA
jgi:phage terminase small subunit